ncbi:squalene epoxidase-domain-containing protein [Suillus tomentosus]|nr:squalene epoxidase-domain-containing protein [Suillus tomentosus]
MSSPKRTAWECFEAWWQNNCRFYPPMVLSPPNPHGLTPTTFSPAVSDFKLQAKSAGGRPSLIENEDTHHVIGVHASKAGGQPESYLADLVIVADGSSSKFRTAVLGSMPYEPSQRGYLAGLILKDLKLPVPQYATMFVLKGAGPVILFELPNNEYRMLVELKESPPDLKEHILRDIVPQLPLSIRAPILNALETSRVRRAPHYYLPPTKQGERSKAGVFLLGDSLNMRHPLTAGGMTVALNDVVILSDLLAHVESFGNWDEISAVLRKWHYMRKPLASTINTMSMSWAGIFAAHGEAFDIMQEGAFKFFGKGAKYSNEPMSLAAGILKSPSLLARNSIAIVVYSIWVLFTHPRPGNKSAPHFYEYPLLLVKALNVLECTGGESKLNLLGAQYWKCPLPEGINNQDASRHADTLSSLQRAISKMSQLIPSTTPIRTFEEHEGLINAVAVFPDKRRMITSSADKTLRLWDLETGVVLKKMEGHSNWVWALAVSRNGQIIASGDVGGEVIAWHRETGESITQPIKPSENRS